MIDRGVVGESPSISKKSLPSFPPFQYCMYCLFVLKKKSIFVYA